MKAVELDGFEGINSLRVVEVEKPRPRANQVLLEVKAAGINFAEIEMTKGRYPAVKKLPFVMGFEAAGIVVEAGSEAKNVKLGDKVTTIVSSGGYAEFATADASFAIPIPDGISFAEATTIPVHGLSAYALIKFAAKPRPDESLLIQAANESSFAQSHQSRAREARHGCVALPTWSSQRPFARSIPESPSTSFVSRPAS